MESEYLVLGFVLLTIYWSIRGLIQIFQRHNAILVVVYIIFLLPVAYLHMLILGIWGSSKGKRMLKEAKNKAKLEKLIEEEKNKS
tara:strand:- start:78 stop:332 length:255 start_codon:yes stop_codon:yes gene_type:complete